MSAYTYKIFLKRLVRHLFILPNAVGKHFTADAMHRIEVAIAKTEATHLGEIHFAVESNLQVLDIFKRKSAKNRAVEVFSNLQVWNTEHNNGVLIYLLIADHDFEILADRGIHQHVGQEGWGHISWQMEAMFRQGQFEAGVSYGIEKIGEQLALHYPADAENVNELSNAPVIL